VYWHNCARQPQELTSIEQPILSFAFVGISLKATSNSANAVVGFIDQQPNYEPLYGVRMKNGQVF